MFSRSASLPGLDPTDDVIPLAINDDNLLLRQSSFLVCFYFEEVLDPQKLCDALEAVLSSSREWSYLGGRLRVDPKTKGLQVHVPQAFSQQRPAFRYTFRDISDTLIASSFPSAGFLSTLASLSSSEVTLLPSESSLAHLFADKSSPNAVSDWTFTDTPIISLHITSFSDSTCVLAGRQPPSMLVRQAQDSDLKWLAVNPLAAAGEGHEGEEAQVATYLARGFALFLLLFQTVFALLWDREKLCETFLQASGSENVPITALGNVTLSTIAWVNTSLGASSMIEGARAVRLSVQIHTSKEETAKQAAFQTSIGYYFIPFYRFGKSQVFYGNSWASMKGHEVDWSGDDHAKVDMAYHQRQWRRAEI
ncbi:MAG: hypothetical protein CYPHOPRED_003603 [Cyphobasidiales sp. Tagirdzhanova-0007]|nr:MAG: hypothetical protein CYPHOPRED_003603 [Cyphobasidiales sp. Tagirdzhanova-0007]